MATKEKPGSNDFIYYAMFAVVAVVFSLYHFARLKRQYVTGPHIRRVFDMRMGWAAMMQSGAVAVGYIIGAVMLYDKHGWTAVISIPLGLYVLNWVGKIQAYAFLGVLVDSQKGIVMFPPNPENLDVGDYLAVVPVVRQYTTLDSIPVDDVQRITRQAGKSLFLHGDFPSRRITFSNKFKRDECIHLIMGNRGKQIRMESEQE
jgi:hypothetical protein